MPSAAAIPKPNSSSTGGWSTSPWPKPCSAFSSRAGAPWSWPAATARPPPPRSSPTCWTSPACAPVFSSAASREISPPTTAWPRGDFFVSEGDEYETAFFDRSAKFFKYRPELLLITALEHDHIDFYRSAESYLQSFRNLVNQVPGAGRIIVNGDYEMARRAVERAFTPVIFYGGAGCACEITELTPMRGGYDFTLAGPGRQRRFHSPLPGPYNVWNLAAGILLADELDLPAAAVEKALATFNGVERRLTLLGTAQATVFLSDFAHHPTAIAGVLGGLPDAYPGHRIVAVFEPRSWSLRRNFFQDRLPDALAGADEIVIKDVFEKEKIPAGERLSVDALSATLETGGRPSASAPVFRRSSSISGRLTAPAPRSSSCCPTATCALIRTG